MQSGFRLSGHRSLTFRISRWGRTSKPVRVGTSPELMGVN